jgi:hypothetical protein
MIQLSEEQSRSIKKESPPRVVADGQEYVLVRADVYEQMKEIIEYQPEEIDPSLYEFDEVEDS